jgi:hypothetical protein
VIVSPADKLRFMHEHATGGAGLEVRGERMVQKS